MSDIRMMSLADRAVAALAAVRGIGSGMTMDRPERYAVWKLRNLAEEILGAAFAQAEALAEQAERVALLAEEVRAEREQGDT